MSSIQPLGEQAVLGVRVSDFTTCPRCQFTVPLNAKVCRECGAPLVPGAQGDVPEEVHQALAKANLLRLRGDYVEAEKTCLQLLRKLPNCAPAHTLLGDIADDRGLIEEAERWFELALDLDSDSVTDRQKLEDIQARRKVQESVSTIEQIGLPTKRPLPWMNIALASIAILSLTYAAFVSIEKKARQKTPDIISTPVSVSPDSVTPAPQEPANSKPNADSPNVTAEVPAKPSDSVATNPGGINDVQDMSLMRTLAQHSPYGSLLVEVQNDPRVKEVTLAYAARPTDDARAIGADLARTTFEQSPTTMQVVVRALRDTHLLYMADVSRAKYAETLSSQWQQANANTPNAFANAVLTNEWNAPDDETPTSGRTP